jgi:hypothetical protein
MRLNSTNVSLLPVEHRASVERERVHRLLRLPPPGPRNPSRVDERRASPERHQSRNVHGGGACKEKMRPRCNASRSRRERCWSSPSGGPSWVALLSTPEIAEEILDICGWTFILWSRIHDHEQRLAERIAGAYLLPQLQQDRHQDPRGDPQDRPDGHGSSRIVGLEEAADGAHGENRDSEHHGHADHAENQPVGLQIEVVQSRSLWPVRGGRAT